VINAGINPSNENPEMKVDTNHKSSALTTNMKSPNVMIVIGREKKSSIGRIKMFRKPKIIATIIAIYTLETKTPGM